MNIKQEQILRTELLRPNVYTADLNARRFVDVADDLNFRAQSPNPVPRPNRPKLLAWDVFIGLLAAADVLKLYGYGQLAADLRQALASNDRVETLAIWRGLKTVMLAASVTAVETEAAKTEPDPNWEPVVYAPSRATTLGLPVITAEDVEATWQRMTGR